MVQKESPIPSSSDKSHVIRTSAQWDSSSDQYQVIPRGVLCIELTSNGKTKIKIGEGNKFYSQLPYICDMGDLSDYYTKEEVDLIIENLEFMSIKSTEEYESRNQLPKTGNKLGDVRFVKNPNNQYDDPLLYVWNGSKWVFSGGSIIDIDLSEYCKKSEILPRLQQLEALSHTHRNKAILDSTSAVYTTEKDEKLASLKNYDVFVPATEEEDGVDGLVPAPSASETNKFLRGDGTWVDVGSGGIDPYIGGQGITIETSQTAEYTQVEYLKSTGTQYILTDIVPDYTMRLDLDVKFGNTVRTLEKAARKPFGYYAQNYCSLIVWMDDNSDSGNLDYLMFYDGFTWYDSMYPYTNLFANVDVTTRKNLILQRGTCYWGDLTCTTANYPITLQPPTEGMPIFAGRTDVGVDPFGKRDMYLYSFKIYNSDNYLIHNLIAVKRNSDNELGLYDLETSNFYPNSGSGTFEAGEEMGPIGPLGPVEKSINANLGAGLSIDDDNNIVNDGVLDVVEKQSAPGVFTVSKKDSDTDIDLFDSLGKITLNCNMNPD